MTILTWKKEFSLGIDEVDHEHREMIDLINRLHQAMGAQAAAEDIEAFLEQISVSIAAHFALEERRMSDMNYSEYPAHKDDHEKLLDEILDLTDEFAEDPATGAQQLGERLSAWFENHFKTHDARWHQALHPEAGNDSG